VKSVGQADFKDLTLKWLEQWRETSTNLSQIQENSVHEFLQELTLVEESYEQVGASVISKWSSLLHECSTIAHSVLDRKINEEWSKIRLKSDLQAARRAAIILPSEASRVFDVLMLIGDFLLCVISVMSEASAIISAIEADNDARLTELRNIAASQKINMGETLELVTKYMKSAEVEDQISKYRSKCFEKLKSVEGGMIF
jgi:hypothetical protein